MGSNEFILGVAFSPDDQQLTSGGGYSTNEIKVWRLSDGELLAITHDQLGQTNSVAYSPDGQLLAAGKANSVATLRNLTTWNVDWLGHRGSVNFVAFSPDGQKLATASDDQSTGLWQVADGSMLYSLNGPSGFVKSVGFSPDGQTVIAAGQDYTAGRGAILFWRVSDGALLRAYTDQTSTAVLSAQYSPDGSSFAYGRADGAVVLARISDVAPTPTPTPPPSPTATPGRRRRRRNPEPRQEQRRQRVQTHGHAGSNADTDSNADGYSKWNTETSTTSASQYFDQIHGARERWRPDWWLHPERVAIPSKS